MDNDLRGLIGQNEFAAWCASNQLVPTQGSFDEYGWDYYVTVDNREQRRSSGIQLVEPSFKVQVKIAQPGDATRPVRLSNLNRMANEQVPWFLFVFEMPLDATVPQAAYVVHFDDKLVAKVLERLRRREAERDDAPLNEISMSIRYNELAAVVRGDLRSRFMADLGSDPVATYSGRKKQWIDTVGLAEHPFHFRFSVKGKDVGEIQAVMADWAVGLREEVDISDAKSELERFGIPLPLPGAMSDSSAEPVAVTIKFPSGAPCRDATMTVSDAVGSKVELDARIYFSGFVFGNLLPVEKHKVRFAARCLEFLATFTKDRGVDSSFRFHYDPSDTLNLKEAAQACRVAALMAQPSPTVLRVEVVAKDGLFPKFHCDLSRQTPYAHDPEFMRFIRVVDSAAKIAKYFDLEQAQIEVNNADLMSRELSVHSLAAALYRTIKIGPISVSTTAPADLAGKPTAILFASFVPLGSRAIGAIVAWRGVTVLGEELEDNYRMMRIDSPEVTLEKTFNMALADWNDAALTATHNEVAMALEGQDLVVVK